MVKCIAIEVAGLGENCIAEKEAWRVEFGLQYTGVYCNRRRLEGLKEAKLYCNTIGCIVTVKGCWVSHDTKFVS